MSVVLFVAAVGFGRSENSVEHGKYLVTLGGCNDCHTPKLLGSGGIPELDTKHLLSGHPENAPAPSWNAKQRNVLATTNEMGTAWAGPWGVSFAANLTPDKETGIAEWSETTFIQMARTGKHQGQPNGRDILAPMPWFNMKNLTDADLKQCGRTYEAFRRLRIRCHFRSLRQLRQAPCKNRSC